MAQCAIRLEGELNVRALLEALQLVVERCEILRTVFRSLPTLGMPLQVVTDGFAPSWRTLDLRQQSGSDVNAVIEGFLQQEARQRFEHDHEPALRTLLLTLPEREHLLIVTAPALCADSGTLGNLWKLGKGKTSGGDGMPWLRQPRRFHTPLIWFPWKQTSHGLQSNSRPR